ncbi:coiled-coil domain-containing protein 178 isoform 2 [Homo sapiens]|uniref:Isoform 2 of Coiled-coil domain-containing protein 178 n=1 Tax=Homo sapiens TaxID=9606 RepID=Q5BJE1-2|nr:coiled-coil domain-containing protein 178 isoform 2 [Homo sapiens]|eukprot:NP_945346.2 coiled-coil domain-containing protein 178 isoform 2 [Homo sapiens]
MTENKTVSSSSTRDDQTNIGLTCQEVKALREKAWSRTNEGNAMSQSLVLYGASKENSEGFHESKMTNTEGVNKGIYFSYPCRRHSCAVVNIPAPCVNKMISHIQDVESKIQEHLKRFETSFEEWSRTSSTKDLKEDWSVTTPVKEVKPGEKRDEKCPELKQEMETLLSEAIRLIKSLETDRADAEEALKQQRSRKNMINMKIDSWSVWKLQELPLAVQKEHEAYLSDVIELQWHLEDKANQLQHFEKQKTELEEANAKIQADIDYMNEHGPLLDSKQNQELQDLKNHYKKKMEVMDLHRKVNEELEEALEACENARLKAQQIKEEIDKDIYQDEKTIEAYKREIYQLNSLFDHYSSSVINVNTNIEEKEEEVTEAIRETKSSKNELHSLSKMLEDLRRVYDQLTWKQKSHENQYLEAVNDFYAAKKTWDIELSDVAKDFSAISLACTKLTEDNKKLEIDINKITVKTNESIRKKSKYESEIKYLTIMKLKNDKHLKNIYKEAYRIGTLFHLTKHKTDEMEDKIAEVRRKFKGREEFLKKLTQGEVAAGMVLQKKLYSIYEVQALERKELIKNRAICAMSLAELQEPLLQLEDEAERIRSLDKEHSVSKRSAIFKDLEATKSKTMIFYAKINELNEELKAKEEEKKSFDQTLEILKNKFITMRFKREHAQTVFDHYMQEKKDCEERIFEEDQRFRVLLAVRQKTLQDTQKIIADSLEENLRLAQEYQQLQITFLKEKDNYFNIYDKQLSLDTSIRDKKQLCQLQRRMHTLWQEHFKLVVLFSQMRLANFQTDSQESIQKILAVQEESSNLMQHILGFFQTLTDGTCENDG